MGPVTEFDLADEARRSYFSRARELSTVGGGLRVGGSMLKRSMVAGLLWPLSSREFRRHMRSGGKVCVLPS
jgi:hypothetical protein